MLKMRVWWKPQVPMRSFYVPVENIGEGAKIIQVLTDYDLFQYENRIKPDYSNMGGIEVFNEELNSWEDWEIESKSLGEWFDDPIEYIKRRTEHLEELKKVKR